MGEGALRIELIARGLAVSGGRVLACGPTAWGYCYLPGGHVEFAEAADVALAREFMEETGLEVRVGALIAAQEQVFRQKGRLRHELNLVFHVEPMVGGWPGEIASREPGLAFRWLRPSEAGGENLLPAGMVGAVREWVASGTGGFLWIPHSGQT
jgi:8-oxo-dGTP diphosphatase